MTDRWIILRCSGPRTLKLAASLTTAGIEAWTPTTVVRKRLAKQKNPRELPAPILPTFVFAPASRLAGLLVASAAPVSQHPAFTVFHDRDRVPVITDRALAPLRGEEDRQRLARRKSVPRTPLTGASFTPEVGAFAGMTGIIESGTSRKAMVNFGGGFMVEIATYLLPDDVLSGSASALTGLAA